MIKNIYRVLILNDKTSFIEAIDSIIKNKEKKSLELINKATENITN